MHIHFVFSFRRDFSSPVILMLRFFKLYTEHKVNLILVPAKQNDVKLYIFKSDTKISSEVRDCRKLVLFVFNSF